MGKLSIAGGIPLKLRFEDDHGDPIDGQNQATVEFRCGS